MGTDNHWIEKVVLVRGDTWRKTLNKKLKIDFGKVLLRKLRMKMMKVVMMMNIKCDPILVNLLNLTQKIKQYPDYCSACFFVTVSSMRILSIFFLLGDPPIDLPWLSFPYKLLRFLSIELWIWDSMYSTS